MSKGGGMEKPPVSVIIVAKNAERTIKECLDSVRRNNPAEIIVVDGVSHDKTVEIAREYTHQIYSDEGRGLNYARQLGAEKASLEYIAYVDSDVVLSEGALAIMLAEFQGSRYVNMVAQEGTDGKFAGYWDWAQYEHNQLRHTEGHLGTLASLQRRETILRYGFNVSLGFPERGIDDLDLEFRLRREGYEFGTSSAIFYHRYKADLRGFARHRFLVATLTLPAMMKYGPWHASFWPPLATLYWTGICLVKAKPKLIPYFIVDGVAKTTGMVWGFYEKMREILSEDWGKLKPFESFVPFSHPNTLWRGLDKRSESILDIGCGKGGPMENINKRGKFHTMGVDIFAPYLKECKAKGVHQEYVLCDIKNLPLRNKSFDIVLCIEGIEHLEKEDGRKLIQAMEKIARRQVIISTPVGVWRQKDIDKQLNPYQKYRAVWFPDELRSLGYKVRGCAVRKLCDEEGLLARLPKIFAPLRPLIRMSAGPFVYLLPRLGADMICFKKLQ